MDSRLWVVICRFYNGTWDICDFAGKPYVATKFRSAHRLKRDIQKYLQERGSKTWYKNRFKVVEFSAREDKTKDGTNARD